MTYSYVTSMSNFLSGDELIFALFCGGAMIAIGTECSVKAGLGFEVSLRDFLGDLLYFQARFFQLHISTPRNHRDVLQQIVKDELIHTVSPFFASGQCID